MKITMSDEIRALNEIETYELISIPKKRKIIGVRWIYAGKLVPDNEKYFKAIYVGKGYS